MIRAAFDVFNPQVVGTRANGDAIIPSFDGGVNYCNIT